MQQFNAAIKRLESKLTSLMDQSSRMIAVLAVRHYRDNFRQGGFVNNTLERWKPLKPNYRPGGTPLVRRGHLRDSIIASFVSREKIVISTDRPYAIYHQDGMGNNPRRQILGNSIVLNKNIKREIGRLARKTLR